MQEWQLPSPSADEDIGDEFGAESTNDSDTTDTGSVSEQELHCDANDDDDDSDYDNELIAEVPLDLEVHLDNNTQILTFSSASAGSISVLRNEISQWFNKAYDEFTITNAGITFALPSAEEPESVQCLRMLLSLLLLNTNENENIRRNNLQVLLRHITPTGAVITITNDYDRVTEVEITSAVNSVSHIDKFSW